MILREAFMITLYDIMPSLWTALSFLFIAAYLCSGSRLMLLGGGASLSAFSPSVLGAPIRLQCAAFFGYCLLVSAACFIKRGRPEERGLAVAVTDIDGEGGYAGYRGSVVPVRCAGPLCACRRGDVLSVKEASDGTLFADRL